MRECHSELKAHPPKTPTSRRFPRQVPLPYEVLKNMARAEGRAYRRSTRLAAIKDESLLEAPKGS